MNQYLMLDHAYFWLLIWLFRLQNLSAIPGYSAQSGTWMIVWIDW